MRIPFCALILLLAGGIVGAHPGVGIVQDSRGNVFYTDAKQVWRITPDGKKLSPWRMFISTNSAWMGKTIYTASTCGMKGTTRKMGPSGLVFEA
jgi:hypothetical protein